MTAPRDEMDGLQGLRWRQRTTKNRGWRQDRPRWRFFVALVSLLWTVDTFTKFQPAALFTAAEPDSFRLIAEQVTSAVVVLLLVSLRRLVAHQVPAATRPHAVRPRGPRDRQRIIRDRALFPDGRGCA